MVNASIHPVSSSKASHGKAAFRGQASRRTPPARLAAVRSFSHGRWSLALQGLADVLMVLLWAAMVPAILWLGVAAGF